MDAVDRNAPPKPTPNGSGGLWWMVVCSLVALAVALVLCANLLAHKNPTWQVVAAGLMVFPILPLLWHGLADPGTSDGTAGLSARSRFALRCLAVALVVLGVSLADLGSKRVGQNIKDAIGNIRARAAKHGAVPFPAPGVATSHGLESFIPADATLAVGLAGSTAMEELLSAHGVDTRAKLAALATCKIDFTSARILLAGRGSGTHLIVVRAPGIGDERNLYCLVGVMGADHLQLRPDEAGGKVLQVSGLAPLPQVFRLLDLTTLVATDAAWRPTVDEKLFAADLATATGPLALPLLRVDRTTPLWVVSVDETAEGAWDLAVDSRHDGDLFKLRGSATPPSGEADRAEISLRVPLAFARALPENAVRLGIRGVVSAVIATGSAPLPTHAPTLPSPPDGGIRAGAR